MSVYYRPDGVLVEVWQGPAEAQLPDGTPCPGVPRITVRVGGKP